MVSLQAALVALALSGAGRTVMLDFYADWCAPCRAMGPTIEALMADGYPVQRVNIDQNRPLAAKFRVTSLPCFVMLVNGREVDRVAGGTSYSRLVRMCQLGAPAAAANQPASVPADPFGQAIPPVDLPRSGLPPPSQPFVPVVPATRIDEPAPLNPPATLPGAEQSVSDADLIAATVRVRVEDPGGRSCGSGTIIDNRDGEALVLTCGHLFRDSEGKGAVSVDLFVSGTPQTVAGRLICYSCPATANDLTRDVGLVAIRCPGPVVIARLAPPDYCVKAGLSVASVGCNNGDAPTVRHSNVTWLNRFTGPPNVEVSGEPVEGRSGGGLFSPEGYVIGVCNAADPGYREGYFGAAASVYAELDREKMAFVYQSPVGKLVGSPETPSPSAVMAGGAAPAGSGLASLASATSNDPPTTAVPRAPSNVVPRKQAALENIRQQVLEGAEVVCVIRPLNNPGAKSQIIRLDDVSAEFLEQLAAEKRRQDEHQARQLAAARPSRKLLEWSAADELSGGKRGQESPQLTQDFA